MPFQRPARADVITQTLTDLETRIPGLDARPARSVANGIGYTHGGAVNDLYGYLENASNQILPDSSDEPVLIRQALVWGIVREQPEASSGNVLCTGTAGVIVPALTLIQRPDKTQYQVTTDTPLGAGPTSVPVISTTVGAATVTPAATAMTFVNPVEGVATAVTVDASGLGGGADIESIDSLRGRLLNRIQQPPVGGSPNDYVTWAKTVPGVTRVWVYPLYLGAGTVGVTFTMDGRDDIIPLPADVANVQAAIDAVKPATANVTVFAPVADPLALTIHLNPDSAALRQAVQAQLQSLITAEAEPAGTMLISHIRQAIGTGVGDGDYTLTVPAANVVEPNGSLTTLGVITWD